MRKINSLKLSMVLACAWISSSSLLADRQTKDEYKPADGSKGYKYLLYLPETKSKGKKPLMVFLHGSGERGNDLSKVKKHGPPKIVENKNLPFIIASPQCPSREYWNAKILKGLVDDVTSKHPVDKNRIYLTGLSMGGYGTWATAAAYPKKFAAIAPICGGGDAKNAKNYGKLPIWNFHGDADKAVPVRRSREMVSAVKKAGGNVKYTEYEGVGHDSWTRTYAGQKLYDWFLSHSRDN